MKTSSFGLLAAATASFFMAGAASGAAGAARSPVTFVPSFVSAGLSTPTVRTVTPTVSRPLRDLVAAPDPPGPPNPVEIVSPQEPGPSFDPPVSPDPAVQRSPGGGEIPAPIATFEGLNNNDNPGTSLFIPPDTEGDVGPNHYVEWVNIVYAIYNRSGAKLVGPLAGNTIFAALGSNLCATQNRGDPLVLYDQLADRWVLSQFAFTSSTAGPFYQCTAVSMTPDPTGAYCLYPFLVSNTVFNDYGKIGLWPDGYYFSFAGFPSTGFTPAAMAVERDAMLACQPADQVYFDEFNNTDILNSAQQRMLPSDLDGSTLPPAGEPNFFVMHDDANDRLQLFEFQVDWTNLANSTFTKTADLPVAPFDTAFTCNTGTNTRQCVPQLGTANRVDNLATRLMYRFAYRNFGTHEALVVNQTVDADVDHSAVRWYEIRDPNGIPTVYQQATYAPDLDHRFMGSAAMDNDGNLAIGFSHSGLTSYPSIRYAGRLATDPLNQLTQGEATMFPGAGPQIASVFTPPAGPARWGDYTHLAIDPVDDCTFWYVGEYYTADPVEQAQGIWHTRIGSFRFSECTSPPTAVRVTLFGARWRGSSVRVSWRTASEVEAVGFNVYRSAGSGPFRRVNGTLIAAKRAGQAGGASYRFVDSRVRRDLTYTYRLQTVAPNGKRAWYGVGSTAARS